MAKTATIQARIDPEVKNKAQNVLSRLNMTLSEAISIFLTQVSLNRGIPFEIKIPNDLTRVSHWILQNSGCKFTGCHPDSVHPGGLKT